MDNSIWDKLTMILIVSKMQSTALKNISPTSANAKDRRKKLKLYWKRAKLTCSMLKGVEDVCIIDSFVVDKANFLSAYKISERVRQSYLRSTNSSRPKEISREQYMKQKSVIKSIIARREKRIWTYSPRINY